MISFITRIFTQTYHSAEKYPAGELTREEKIRPMIVFVVAAVTLTMNKYIADHEFTAGLLSGMGFTGASGEFLAWINKDQLHQLCYWSGTLSIFYFILPAFIIRFVFRQNLGDYGLRVKNGFPDIHLYVIMLILMIPLVMLFSGTQGFQEKYPFYDVLPGDKLGKGFWTWELFYFIQFFSLEFFFRGFMVHGTKQRLGFYSVFVMMIPYCMIHFGKPLPETLAAIVAGIVLGTLSLKSRSVLPGVMIHYAVAITMDILSLFHKGIF